MRVLLVGAGGREHALAWKIAQSPLCEHLWIVPGNPGTATLGTNVDLAADDAAGIVGLATREQIDLVVVGPEAPLVEGLGEVCDAVDLAMFGPSSEAAQLEGSKAFAKMIMLEAGVPTAAAHTFDDPAAAIAFVEAEQQAWVVKADGLAAGKGVIVPAAGDVAATISAIRELVATNAGNRLVLEEILTGPEVSLLALCDGERALPLIAAQDHKRIGDNDTGGNTGGMGAYAPAPILPYAEAQALVDVIFTPVLRTMAARNIPYRGVLYAGLMLTPNGVKVIEFNARFGDPETQALLPLLKSDLLELLHKVATSNLADVSIEWHDGAAVCVVLSAAGYPAKPRTGDVITGLDRLPSDVLAFQAGTATNAQGDLVTAGGRVLGITAVAPSLQEARDKAYAASELVEFAGKYQRSDIAARGLAE
ncbi:phosphoribosylamine--glycine ligase [Herpetosiphon llansteffanensis]|uniref:phosphoribosylamine--glycine ligase n=1 Tax=Herpetosiphon llansteffanensis TaxID=2094568 RepID=UPI000D7CF6DB|nr:phosphoribosylamine--glycine ligase [Herpetosiphon llansteffanensis]